MSKIPYAGKTKSKRVYKGINVQRAKELRRIWEDGHAERSWTDVGKMLAREEGRATPYNEQAVSRAVRRSTV